MNVGIPRPRPWTDAAPPTASDDGVRRLTVPEAYALYCGVVGYRLPAALNRAARLSRALTVVR